MNTIVRGTRSPWYATPVVAVAVLLGFNGLTTMIVWGPWLGTAILLMAVVTVAISVSRMLSHSRLLPTLVGAIVGIALQHPRVRARPRRPDAILPHPVRNSGSGARRTRWNPCRRHHRRACRGQQAVARSHHGRRIRDLPRGRTLGGVMEGCGGVWPRPRGALDARHHAPAPGLGELAARGGGVLGCPARADKETHRRGRTALNLRGRCRRGGNIVLVAIVAPPALGGNGWGMIPRFSTPNGLDRQYSPEFGTRPCATH